MIAALQMYDFDWLRAATDRLWATIRDRLRAQGIEAPESLTRSGAQDDIWGDPGLLLSQTCGYPFWKTLRRKTEALATPIYGFSGCEGPNHCSFILAHRDDPRTELAQFRGDRAAVNGFASNSGMNLFRASIAPLAGGKPFFADIVETGAHVWSLAAIAEGRAELAAIDCVSYALLTHGAAQWIGATKIIARTPSSPGLPFIASRLLPPATRAAVRQALRALPPFPELGFCGVAFLPETAYARIEDIEREAAELGYPRLA
ncbi:MAG: PhnD/SsuA/transferrin family substrate-binding protein [Pseudomonadota bacterium]|nr:PhnD/SsuA/transferrin family substrate-binding protein [Pseudomonadota bacterium]